MTKPDMTNIASRVFGAPLMIEPGKAAVIASAFGPKMFDAVQTIHVTGAQAGEAVDWPTQKRAGSILHDGLSDYTTENATGFIRHGSVAVIEVIGSLVRRGAWLGQHSGMTSYEGLRAQLKAAAADPKIKAIALEFDSPGGEAAGCFELADLVRSIRDQKPVYGFCAEYAYSAAYALASQCDVLTVPEYGGAGSIGVIMMHAEQSKKLDQDGLTVTIIRSGAHKAEGNSVEPLPEALREEWQTEADKMRIGFAELVGKGRGDRLTGVAALKTEARCFTGAEAVRRGLADRVADPKTAFDAMVASVEATGRWDGVVPVPTARTAESSPGCAELGNQPEQTEKELDMSDKTKQPDAKVVDGDAKAQTAQPAPVANDAPQVDAAGIVNLVARAGLPAKMASDLIAQGATMDQARDQVIDAIADKNAGSDGGDIRNHAPAATVTGDGVDRMRAGMVEALSAKAGLDGGRQNEFSSLTLREMARASLQARGLQTGFSSSMQLVGAAFVPTLAGGLHTGSDFGNVLADVANKALLKAYQEAPENFEKFTKRGTLTDFKPSTRVGLGVFPNLDEVAEGAEFKMGTVGDHGESILLATYGKLFAISRQAVINDDLSAFTDMPAKMGRAAKRTVAALVYGILNTNGNMSDGNPLFDATHNNLAGSGAAPSEATIDAALQAMAAQKPRGATGSDVTLNLQPKYLLAPYKHRSAVLAALMSEKTPDTTGNKSSQRYNTVYQAAEPIFDNRVSGDQWFMLADPQAFDTIEVAYLDGISEPFIDQQNGWSVDGTEFKVRLDAGVAATAWEGMYKNAGA